MTTIELFSWKFLVDDGGGLQIRTNKEEAWLVLNQPEAKRLISQLYAALERGE